MITQSTFEKIQKACFLQHCNGVDDDLKNIIFPKLFVLHKPSGQGFYVDKDNDVILSVSECVEPKHKTKIPNSRFYACPFWAHSHPISDFDTFILGES